MEIGWNEVKDPVANDNRGGAIFLSTQSTAFQQGKYTHDIEIFSNDFHGGEMEFIRIGDSYDIDSVYIYNNTLRHGVNLIGGIALRKHSVNVHLYNNVFYKTPQPAKAHVQVTGTSDLTTANNIFFGASGQPVFDIETFQGAAVVSNNDLFFDEAGGSIPNEFGLTVTNAIVGDPLFTDPENGNFSLRPGSPAEGTATLSVSPVLTRLLSQLATTPNLGVLDSMGGGGDPCAGANPPPYCNNQPPVANAGPDQEIAAGALLVLDGSDSYDPDDDPLRYAWTQISGPRGELQSPSSAIATLQTPSPIANDATLTFRLTVSDPYVSASDEITVIVRATVPTLFEDDYDDGNLDPNYTHAPGTWEESGGSLNGAPSRRKSETIADPAFAGCSLCTLSAELESNDSFGNPKKGKFKLFGWYEDKRNNVSLTFKPAQNRIVFLQKVKGKTKKSKKVAKATIDENVVYDVKVQFTGSEFLVFVDGQLLITTKNVARGAPNGTFGFGSQNSSIRVHSVKVE